MNLLLNNLRTAILSWWRDDRIRVSPNEGRLLRIESGDILQIGQTQLNVVSRSISESESAYTLFLKCETITGNTEVQIQLDKQTNQTSVRFSSKFQHGALSTTDIEIWPRQIRKKRTHNVDQS